MIPSHYRFFKSDVNVHRGRFAEIKVDEAKAARDRGDEYSVGIFDQGELIWGANIRDGMTGYLSATFRSSGQPFAGYQWERKEDRMQPTGCFVLATRFPGIEGLG